MTTNPNVPDDFFQAAHSEMHRLKEEMTGIIVGQENLITDLLVVVFAGGHLLIEGLPGLGKTHLAKAIAGCMGLPMARIQCTPDLMPADVTGTELLVHDEQRQQQLSFQPGPIFSSMVLVDEINRATPKTQAAFLEAMQENQITYVGKSHPLPTPFWVLATQNPIELEGTYPLPEAQLDRFMFKVNVPYPSADALRAMLDVSLDNEPADHVTPVLTAQRTDEIMRLMSEVIIAEPLKHAAVELIMATQPQSKNAHPLASLHFRYGASPRGLQAILRTARVRAVLDGRAHVSFDDIMLVALPALRHRILLTLDSEMDGIDIDSVLDDILLSWRDKQ